jgi:protein gp37
MKETKKCAVTNRASHKIGWLNLPGYKGETWNPIIGCSKVSAGCENCYAERMAVRLSGIEKTAYYSMVTCRTAHTLPTAWTGRTELIQSQLTKPMKWKKPRVVFVCSMGDLFHENTSFEDIDQIFATMASCQQHIFILLTKRAGKMHQWFNWKDTSWKNEGMQGNERIRYYAWMNHGKEIEYEDWKWPLPNVWLGVTAENQETANERLPYLIKIPAAIKLVSVEPMLGPLNISMWMATGWTEPPYDDVINWVICGGESGPGSRPMHPDWVRSLRYQCKEAEVPFFFKQWGEWMPMDQVNDEQFFASKESKEVGYGYTSNTVFKVGKKAAGNLLDGERWEQYPEPETCNVQAETLNPKP